MPKNNLLQSVLNKHEKQITKPIEFDIDVEALQVKLIYAPSLKELENFIPQFALATWSDEPGKGKFYDQLKSKAMELLFDEKLLPTAYECINLVFEVSGLEVTTITHLIRHRTLSFSARSNADRDNRNDRCTIPGSIENNQKFNDRYKKICNDSAKLYGEMLDSNEVSTLDARQILPRSSETFYYVRGNLKDIMTFIRARLDVQIQPHTDNILAMLFWREILKIYPMLHKKIDFEQKDMFYINTARTDVSCNIFPPASKNDIFEWNEKDFIHNKHRDEFIGAEYYLKRKQKIIDEIKSIIDNYIKQ